MDIKNSVVAIIDFKGKIVGTGFVVDDHLLLTCAHVVEQATAGLNDNVKVIFSNKAQAIATVKQAWFSPIEEKDVAVLHVNSIPTEISPLPLAPAAGSAGHEFYAYGYATFLEFQGIGARGEIVDIIEDKRFLQLKSQDLDRGMSGGPVWDDERHVVVGMVTRGKRKPDSDGNARNVDTTLATTVEVIREVCQALQLSEVCPYRSLDSFNEKDAHFFFGREDVIQRLLDSLRREPRFLAVLGPSGGGKSSVVKAGLVPALRRGEVPGSQNWDIITIRPATQPFIQLAKEGFSDSETDLVKAFQARANDHKDITRTALIIDQFEELLVSVPEDVRNVFINELVRLLDSSVKITLILTMRDDFYSRLLDKSAELAGWLERGLVNIPPSLRKAELRAMIYEPAKAVGLKFDTGLVDDIIADACETDRTGDGARSTVLPLLEFALTKLWELRKDGQLTHAAYQSVGKTTGSLSQWADTTYYELSPTERKITEQIFCGLVHLGDEKEQIPDTRRVILIDDLISERNRSDQEKVLHRLVQSRLLSLHKDPNTGQEYVEIIHDAMLREWALLKVWINNFRRREEIRQERRRTMVIIGLAVGLILVMVLAIFAWIQRNNAVYQAEIALSRQLVAQAESTIALRSSLQMISVLLATYSMEIHPSSEASKILLGSTNAQTIASTFHEDGVKAVAFSKDGKRMVSAGGLTVIVIDVESDKELARRKHNDLVFAATFSPDGNFIVSGGKDKEVCVWEIATQTDIHCFSKEDNPYIITFSPDNRYFSAAGEEFIHIWDTKTSARVNRIRDNTGPVTSLVFSQDGKWVVAGDKQFAHVWNVESGKEVARLRNEGQVNSVALDPLGKYVVTGGEDFSVRIWDIATKKETLRMLHAGPVTSVLISPDGKLIASASRDNTIRLWNPSTGGEVIRMTHDNSVFTIAFSPSGNHIVSASSDKTARIWETGTGREVARMTHDELVYAIAISADGKYVVSGGYDHRARVWRTKSNAELARMTHDGKVYTTAFSPQGVLAASGSSDNTVRVWNVFEDQEIFRIEHTGDVFSLAFNKDGSYLVSGGGKSLIVTDVATGKAVMQVEHQNDIYTVAYSPDGKYVAAGGNDFTACTWLVSAGTQEPQACMPHDGKVHSVSFSPDSKFVISVSDDKTARIWDVITGKEVLRLSHETEVFSAAYSPDGKFIATGDTKYATLWDAQTGAKLTQVTHDLIVYSVVFSPDGQRLASGGGKAAKIWSVPGGDEIFNLPHNGNINWVAFNKTGDFLVTGDDLSAQVWNLLTGAEVARMSHGNLVKAVAFSPDNKFVISGGVDRTARVWLWDPANLISNTCATMPRNLTEDEWKQYLEDRPYTVICPNLEITPTP